MASDGHSAGSGELSLPPATWSQSGQVSLTLAQRPGPGGERSSSEEEEMEGTGEIGETGGGWETSMRRDQHGKKVAGTGARVASSTPRHTPASNRGGAGLGSRRPVSATTQIDRSQLVYQSIAIELNGQNITRGEVIDALMGLVEERDVPEGTGGGGTLGFRRRKTPFSWNF